jgi:hypothetical protein
MPGTPPGSPSGAMAAAAKAKTVADSGIEEAADDSLKLLALQEQQAHDAHAAKERAAAASPPDGSSSSTPEPSLRSVHDAMLLHEVAAVLNLYGLSLVRGLPLDCGQVLTGRPRPHRRSCS